jgi:multidrug efflux system outer membrane protein
MPKWCLTGLLVAGAVAAPPLFSWASFAESTAAADEPPTGGTWGSSLQAPVTIRAHAYTLAECLALAERNFPNLWAARARLAQAHAQLDEAKWTPWFQWSAHADFGVLPSLQGTVLYPQSSTQNAKDVTGFGNLGPFFGFGLSGVVPLYTFGKIDAAADAATANVRVAEWDMEKGRQAMRLDVRRAFFGLEAARDAKYVADEALDRLDGGIRGIKEKIAKGDTKVSDADRLRLEAYRQDIVAQSLQAPKAEAYALGALRMMTGVETFDIVDEPLRRPERPLVAIVQYLEAARIFRPDVNMARAGVVARQAMVNLGRAKLFPDFGIGLGADYMSTPGATQQDNPFANDPFNHFYYYGALGMRWGLDLLPQLARTEQAESQLEETRALERLALSNATYEVEKAYADAVEAKGREEAWDRAEHIAKEWISLVQDHIDLGTSDEPALLEPLRSYGSARLQHLTALMDYNVAMSHLAMASGWDSAGP